MVVARVNVYFSVLDEYERRRNEALLVGFGAGSPENLRMSDPLRCNSKHSETFLLTLYLLDLYISINYFEINSEFSIICVFKI